MPLCTGVELFEKVFKIIPDTTRVLLTGYSNREVIIDSINKVGIYRYLTKPYKPELLLSTVKNGIELYQVRKDLKDKPNKLEKMLDEFKAKNLELKAKNLEVEAKNIEVKTKNSEVEEKNLELKTKNCEIETKNQEILISQQKLIQSDKMAALGSLM